MVIELMIIELTSRIMDVQIYKVKFFGFFVCLVSIKYSEKFCTFLIKSDTESSILNFD